MKKEKEKLTSIVDEIEKKLILYIKENQLLSGDSLPSEVELCRILEVSRPTLREAMTRLKTLGLIKSQRYKGMVVTQPDLVKNFERMLDPAILNDQMLSNLFEFRLMLEIGMVDLIFARKTKKQLRELEEIVENSEVKKCDSLHFHLDDEIQFHGKLYEMAGNELLQKFQIVLLPVFKYVNKRNRQKQPKMVGKENPVTHKDLLEELKKGTPSSFRELMHRHLKAHFENAIENTNGV